MPAALEFPLLAPDRASPSFLRVADAAAKTAATTNAAVAGVARYESVVSRARGTIVGAAKDFAKLGGVLAGVEIVKKGAEFIGAGRDLTTALNSVQAVSRASDTEMRKVRATVIGLGKDMTIPAATAVDAADALQDLVKAGIALPRALEATRPALLLAAATQTKMADTARVLGDTMDIWSISGKGAAHTAAILGSAALGASHDLVGLFDALKQAGPSARALHIGLDDTATSLVFLAKHGLSAEMGGTGLKVLFSTLSKDTPEGVRALKDLGVQAFNAQGVFEGFPKLFDQLHSAQGRFGSDSHRFLHDLNAAFGSRAQNVASLFATSTGREFDELRKHLEAGDLQKFADQQNRGVTAGLKAVSKELTAAGIDVYSRAEPTLTKYVDTVGVLLPKAFGIARSALAPLGPALDVFGSILSGAAKAAGLVFSALQPIAPVAADIGGPLLTVALGAKAFTAATIWVKGTALALGDFAVATKASAVATVSSNRAVALSWEQRAAANGTAIAGSTAATVAGDEAQIGANAALVKSNQLVATSGAGRAGGMLGLFRGSAGMVFGAYALAAGIDSITRAITKEQTVAAHGFGPLDAVIGQVGVMNEKVGGKLGSLLDDASKKQKAAAHSMTTALQNMGTVATPIKDVAAALHLSSDAATQYATMLGIAIDDSGNLAHATAATKAAILAVANAYDTANSSGTEFLQAWQQFATSTGSSADRASLIGAILKANAGDALSYQSAINSAVVSVKQLGADSEQAASQVGKSGVSLHTWLSGVVDLKTGVVSYWRPAAATLLSDLSNIQTSALASAQAYYQHNRALLGGKQAADAAISGYTNVEGSLKKQLVAMGLTKTAAQNLINTYLGVPKNVRTQIESAGTDSVVSVLNHIGTLIARLAGQPWNIVVSADTSAASAALADLQHQMANTGLNLSQSNGLNKLAGSTGSSDRGGTVGRADGGIIRGPGGPRDDRAGIYALSNGEAVIPTLGVQKHRHLVDFLIAEGRGRAQGGVIGTTSATAIYRVGAGWGFQGQYYGGKTGQKDALSARADYVHGQQAAALYHSPESRTAVVGDTGAYRSAIASGDVSQARAAYATLYLDAKAAGANTAALARLSAQEKAVVADLQRRAVLTDQVSKATDYLTGLQSKAADLRTSVAGAVTGTFNIATAGQPFSDRAASADSILAELTAKADKAAAFGALLTTLGKEGLDPGLIQQLAEAGPAAYAQAKALAEATPAKLAAINAQSKRLNTAGSVVGGYVSNLVFGSQIATANALLHGFDPKKNPAMAKAVAALGASLFGAGKLSGAGLSKGLLGERAAVASAAAQLGLEVEQSLRRSLGIHSPSRVARDLGRFTGMGFALGLADSVPHVARASSMVGEVGVPTAPAGSGPRGGDTYIHHEWNISEVDNGMEVHHKVMRRLALSGP